AAGARAVLLRYVMEHVPAGQMIAEGAPAVPLAVLRGRGLTRIARDGFGRDARQGLRIEEMALPGGLGQPLPPRPEQQPLQGQVLFLQAGVRPLKLLGRRAGLVELMLQVVEALEQGGVLFQDRAELRLAGRQVVGDGRRVLRHDDLDVSGVALFEGFANDSARRGSADPAVALAPPRGGQVDPVEDQGQVSGRELDPRGARKLRGTRSRLRVLEATDLKSLVPDDQPVTVKIEDLDPISATVKEEEEMAGQEVLAEALLDQSGKAVKAFARIGRPGAQEHADGRGELREHQSPPGPSPPSRPATRMAMRSNSGSTAPLSRTMQALASSIS